MLIGSSCRFQITASLQEKQKIFQIHPENKDLSEGHKWFNTYMSKLLSQISKRWTPLLSFEDKDKKKDKALDENNDNEKDKNKKKDNTTSKQGNSAVNK